MQPTGRPWRGLMAWGMSSPLHVCGRVLRRSRLPSGTAWHSIRWLHTPLGGFDEELPGSFGRSASDKGKGGPLSVVNTRRKRIFHRLRHREPLLNPRAAGSEAEGDAQNGSETGADTKSYTEKSDVEMEDVGFHDVTAVLEQEREISKTYSVTPSTTVFGSDLDRLEEDYLREFGQLGDGIKKRMLETGQTPPWFKPLSVTNSSSTAPPTGAYERYGAAKKGKRLRWTPSTSFDWMVAHPTPEAHQSGRDFGSEDGSASPYRYGTLAEQRRNAKRHRGLVAGSDTNHHLSAYANAADAEREEGQGSSIRVPGRSPPVLSAEPETRTDHGPSVQGKTLKSKNPSRGRRQGRGRTVQRLIRMHLNSESTSRVEEIESSEAVATQDPSMATEAGTGIAPVSSAAEDLPAAENPHFASSELSASKGSAEAESETSEILYERLGAFIPSHVHVDGSRAIPFQESRHEERRFQMDHALTKASPSSEPQLDMESSETGTVYDAYHPRPWEEILPVLRDANYWDSNPEHRSAIDAQLEHEAKKFQQEQLEEGAIDTSEVEYATQKLRKEMLLYFQAHPMNEMITEAVVRIREIYPPPRRSSKGTTLEDARGKGSLRYHPEALLYPSEWLAQQQMRVSEEGGVDADRRAEPLNRHEVSLLREVWGRDPARGAAVEVKETRAEIREGNRKTLHSNEEGGGEEDFQGERTSEDKTEGEALHGCSEEDAKRLITREESHGGRSLVPRETESEEQYFNRCLRQAVDALYQDRDVPLSVARRLATALGLDLIRIGSLYTSQTDRRIIALCALGDHREHLRDIVRFKLQKLGVQPPPTMASVEVPFRGGTHPHAMRVKAAGISKRLLHRHVVRVQLTKFGTPREGFAVLQTILDEVRHQCAAVHAHHTAGRIQSSYHEIFCYLYPSTGKTPKHSIQHPSPKAVRAARDLRLLADEKEVFFDDYHNLVTQKQRLQYATKLADGTAWTFKDEGLSLRRQRAIKVMLGYLPKGNNEMYAARGDVNIPAPFRAQHPTSVDRWTNPEALDNLEQASRGAAVLGKRAAMGISTMHDTQETEDQPSTLDRFYYRVQGSALELGELKEALGLKENRRKGKPLAPGFATLGPDGSSGKGPRSEEEAYTAAK